jgi:DNA-binding transcriptional LysR family regulator
MNIVDLESFVAVVDCGSIVAAAARLHITQSAISRRIQNLEESLGTSLLDRQKRPLQLTTAGKAMYENARPVLGAVDDLKSAVVHDGEPSGAFRFGVARGLGDAALTRPIEVLRKEFPLLQLQAYSQWTEPLLDKIRSRSIDAAAVLLPTGEVPPVTVDSEYLGKQNFVIVDQKTASHSRTTTLEEISSRGWVLSPDGCGTRYNVESVLLRRGLPFQIAVEAEGKELQLSLVAQGVGLGIVPSQVFASSVYKKRLCVVRVKDFDPIQDLWLVSSKHIGRRARVVQALKSALLLPSKLEKPSGR